MAGKTGKKWKIAQPISKRFARFEGEGWRIDKREGEYPAGAQIRKVKIEETRKIEENLGWQPYKGKTGSPKQIWWKIPINAKKRWKATGLAKKGHRKYLPTLAKN